MVHAELRSDRRREDRREQILDVAMKVLRSQGHDGLTLRRVSVELGYVPAALYRYYASKDALIAALQRRAIGQLAHRLAPHLQGAEASKEPLLAMLGVADVYLRLPQDDPESFALIATLLGDPRPLISDEESRKTEPQLMTLLTAVGGLFEEAKKVGQLGAGPSLERTLAFWALLHGMLALDKARRIAPGLPTAHQLGLQTAVALLVGYGADSKRLAKNLQRLLKTQAESAVAKGKRS